MESSGARCIGAKACFGYFPPFSLATSFQANFISGKTIKSLNGLLAKEPVRKLMSLINALLSFGGCPRRRNNNQISGLPAFRCRNFMSVGNLQSLQQPQKLRNGAITHGIINHGPQNTLRIDEKRRPNGRGIAGSGLDHAISVDHLHRQVLNNGEGDINPELIFDGSSPCNMGKTTVDGKPQQLVVQFMEFRKIFGETNKLRSANRREIRRVREKNQSIAFVIRQLFDAMGRIDFEHGCGFIQPREQKFGDIFSVIFFLSKDPEKSYRHKRTMLSNTLCKQPFQPTNPEGSHANPFAPTPEPAQKTSRIIKKQWDLKALFILPYSSEMTGAL